MITWSINSVKATVHEVMVKNGLLNYCYQILLRYTIYHKPFFAVTVAYL